MKTVERNLLTSAIVATEEAEGMIDLINDQPYSKIVEERRLSANTKIAMAIGFIKALKIISCTHNTKHGSSTGVMYGTDYSDLFFKKKIRSFREVTKRCHNCNQVFYRKRYNLLGKKKNDKSEKNERS